MDSLLKAVASCICPSHDTYDAHEATYLDEKVPLYPSKDRTQEAADRIVNLVLTAEKNDADFRARIRNEISTCDWKSWLAERVYNGLLAAIEAGKQLNAAVKEALDKAAVMALEYGRDAVEFTKEHPVYVTILVLGVLVCLAMPWIIELLGFAEEGIVEASFAARWQSTFPNVPKGSLFAYLQRLGMTWGK